MLRVVLSTCRPYLIAAYFTPKPFSELLRPLHKDFVEGFVFGAGFSSGFGVQGISCLRPELRT